MVEAAQGLVVGGGGMMLHCSPGGLEHTGDWGFVAGAARGLLFSVAVDTPFLILSDGKLGRQGYRFRTTDDGNVSWEITTASSASCSPMRARHYMRCLVHYSVA